MAVYSGPLFTRGSNPGRAQGNDKRIRVPTLRNGAALLAGIVAGITAPPGWLRLESTCVRYTSSCHRNKLRKSRAACSTRTI